MAYESTQIKIAVPSEFIVEYGSFINEELRIFRNLTPLPRKISQIAPFRVEWNLSGKILWGAGFPGSLDVVTERTESEPHEKIGPAKITQDASSFSISNHGLVAFIPQSAQETLMNVELEYEPFRDQALWELFLKVFSTPRHQVEEDLALFATRMEATYVEQLFHPAPKTLWSESGPAVVSAA